MQRRRLQNYNPQQQQLLQRQLQQQNQHQAYLNSIHYPGQESLQNYPQGEIHKLGLNMPQNTERRRFSTNTFQYPEALAPLVTSTFQPVLPVTSTSTEAAAPPAVRLSNLKTFDLLKRKKPQAHVLAALRQTKIDEDSDLINENVGRLNRRTKKFKFQFQKSRDSDKLEIESNADAKLISNNKDKQQALDDVNNQFDQNNEDLVVVQEEIAPAVVLIKKVTRPNSTSISTSTVKTTTEQAVEVIREESFNNEENLINSESKVIDYRRFRATSSFDHSFFFWGGGGWCQKILTYFLRIRLIQKSEVRSKFFCFLL